MTKDELLNHPTFMRADGNARILIMVGDEIGWLEDISLDQSDRDSLGFHDEPIA